MQIRSGVNQWCGSALIVCGSGSYKKPQKLNSAFPFILYPLSGPTNPMECGSDRIRIHITGDNYLFFNTETTFLENIYGNTLQQCCGLWLWNSQSRPYILNSHNPDPTALKSGLWLEISKRLLCRREVEPVCHPAATWSRLLYHWTRESQVEILISTLKIVVKLCLEMPKSDRSQNMVWK